MKNIASMAALTKWYHAVQEMKSVKPYKLDQNFPSITETEKKTLLNVYDDQFNSTRPEFVVDRFLNGQSGSSIHDMIWLCLEKEGSDEVEISMESVLEILRNVFMELLLHPLTSQKYLAEVLSGCIKGRMTNLALDTILYPQNKQFFTERFPMKEVMMQEVVLHRINGDLIDNRILEGLVEFDAVEPFLWAAYSEYDLEAVDHIAKYAGNELIGNSLVACSKSIVAPSSFVRSALQDRLTIPQYCFAMVSAIKAGNKTLVADLFSERYAAPCFEEIYITCLSDGNKRSKSALLEFAKLSVLHGADPYKIVLQSYFGRFEAIEKLLGDRFSDEELINFVTDQHNTMNERFSFVLLSINEKTIYRHEKAELCWQALHTLTGEHKYLSRIKSLAYRGDSLESGLGL